MCKAEEEEEEEEGDDVGATRACPVIASRTADELYIWREFADAEGRTTAPGENDEPSAREYG